MRYLILSLTIMMFAFGSCNNERNKDSDGSAKSNKSESEEVFQSCDEFLDAYEAWADKYIGTLKIFKTDPSNPKLAKMYSYQTREMTTWQNIWNQTADCATDEIYLKRYTMISEKIEREQRRLEGSK